MFGISQVVYIQVKPFSPSRLPTNQVLPLQKECGKDLEGHQVYQQNRQFLCPVLYMNEHTEGPFLALLTWQARMKFVSFSLSTQCSRPSTAKLARTHLEP